jgi:hypothetical protein
MTTDRIKQRRKGSGRTTGVSNQNIHTHFKSLDLQDNVVAFMSKSAFIGGATIPK